MFTHYVEIKVIEKHKDVYNLIFQHLHNAFSEVIDADSKHENHCALSMPFYNKERFTFGTIIRVLAENEEIFQTLDLNNRLDFLASYVMVSKVKHIPTNVKSYARYVKESSNTRSSRIRHYMHVHNVSREVAEENVKDIAFESPFVHLISNSSGNKYPLIIGKKSIKETDAKMGLLNITTCNRYGLNACVPEW